jgi:dolichyl-phosphate beta-glucosyltransferase
MIDLSIIIPAFNEEERITNTIQSFTSFLSQKTINYELIVVDDGSSDKTIEVVEDLGVTIPNLRVIALPQNKGKGAAKSFDARS